MAAVWSTLPLPSLYWHGRGAKKNRPTHHDDNVGRPTEYFVWFIAYLQLSDAAIAYL